MPKQPDTYTHGDTKRATYRPCECCKLRFASVQVGGLEVCMNCYREAKKKAG
jgi:protein-arginine kinase activator protein McsA